MAGKVFGNVQKQKKGFCEFNLNKDFVDVKDVFAVEELTEEDIEDGVEPMDIHFKVGITKHANDSLSGNRENRWCDWKDVEELIQDKASKVIDLKHGEEFILVNENSTLAIVGQISTQDNLLVIALITIIRKVFVDKITQTEYEKRVMIDKDRNIVL